MSYNFDEIVDRSNNYAAKFQEAELHYGTNNVIPLWIADMDFRTAPCIVEAIKERADPQGIFGYTWRTPSTLRPSLPGSKSATAGCPISPRWRLPPVSCPVCAWC